MVAGAIVPAGGRGERLGSGQPKALVAVAGVPLLVHAVRSLLAVEDIRLVVVAAPTGHLDVVTSLVPEAVVVEGGATRQESVGRALEALPDDVDVVLVHDAARGLAPTMLAERVLAALHAGAAAVVPGLPISDTMKEVDADDVVTRTLDRSLLRAIQTPQGFRRDALERAHRRARTDAVTDDAGLLEADGVKVQVVPGEQEAFKVTTPFDLALAEAIARGLDRV
jgi:2-C-methyl-D-erythritol 4-phosphate cytidylyltransferase